MAIAHIKQSKTLAKLQHTRGNYMHAPTHTRRSYRRRG